MCEIVQHATTGKLLLAIINSGQRWATRVYVYINIPYVCIHACV